MRRRQWLKDEVGQTVLEYALVLAGTSIASAVAIGFVADGWMMSLASQISGAINAVLAS